MRITEEAKASAVGHRANQETGIKLDPRAERSGARVRKRPVVLFMLVHFWPGHEATGPNQSFNSLAASLHEEFEFKVVAVNRSEVPAAHGRDWHDERTYSIRYVRGQAIRVGDVISVMRDTPHDLLVLNGFFDRFLTIPALMARRMGLTPSPPVILSPRGEFSAGRAALAKKHKQLYLAANRRLGLLDGVTMHSTGEDEARDIRQHCPWASEIVIAPNIRSIEPGFQPIDFSSRAQQPLRLVFLSRIDRKKNLHYALDVIQILGEPVTLDIYGPVTDEAYWQACQKQI